MIILISVRRTLLLLLLTITLFVSSTPFVFARHQDEGSRYSAGTSRAIEDLDNDPVDTFPVPILFGLPLSSISPDFGDPRGGGTRLHEGQDMMGVLGTPIVSPTDAVVMSRGTGESAGKYVYTANPGGESWRYMHLDQIADIKPGDVLKAGDFIGTVGDTGNASGGAAHLHFEIRKDGALDPYPRLGEAYELKEKMALVTRLFRNLDDSEEMAEFLVSTFLSDFTNAQAKGYSLPREITNALKEQGVVDTSELQAKLREVIASIPSVVSGNLLVGDADTRVALMQFFLIYQQTGPAAASLGQSGATGYFGPVTAAAFREYQTVQEIAVTGQYDAVTRTHMIRTLRM